MQTEDQGTETCILQLINMLSKSDTYGKDQVLFENPEIQRFYKKNVCLSSDKVLELCLKTKTQSESKEWFHARQMRISASKKAYTIGTTRSKIPADLAKNCQRRKLYYIQIFYMVLALKSLH